MRLKWILICVAVAGSFASLRMTNAADECAYRDGGYCVSMIVSETASKLAIETPSPLLFPNKREGVTRGTSYLNYYEIIWATMIKDGKATQNERDLAFAEAGKAGGTKIGGVNLVVLAARTLQQLIDKGAMTKEEAQGILNKARE